jgi:hypothetical protein
MRARRLTDVVADVTNKLAKMLELQLEMEKMLEDLDGKGQLADDDTDEELEDECVR